jgi:hypothetical protein
MAYGLPIKGQADYDDELNNSIEFVRSAADAAQAKADNAATSASNASTTANTALTKANEAMTFATSPTDEKINSVLTDGASDARGTLNAAYAGVLTATSGDETAAINTFLAAAAPLGAKRLVGSFSVSDALTVPAGLYLDLTAATITQTGTNKTTLSVGAGVTILGGKVVGLGTDYAGQTSLGAIGISLPAGSHEVRIANTRLSGHAGVAVKVRDSTDVAITGCTITGTTPPAGDGFQYGVLLDGTAKRVTVSACDISATAQGVITGIGVTDARIFGNAIHDISGQHGMYLQNGTRVVVTGNDIWNTNLMGAKVQLSASTTADSTGLVIIGNTVDTCGDQGIALTNSDTARTYKFRGAIIANNVVRSAASAGLYLDALRFGIVAGNQVSASGQHGIFVTYTTETTVAENVVENVGRVGIFLNVGYSRVTVRGNAVTNPATANVSNTQYGIYALSGDRLSLIDNTVFADNGLMVYGIFFGSGDQATSTWRDNRVDGATSYGARLINGAAVREWRNNNFQGTTGPVLYWPTTGIGRRGREEFGTAAPTAGGYLVGDVVWNTAPIAGGAMGWVCTTAGAPGTWKTFGAISA